MKTYTITQRVYFYKMFEESEIPAGMTPEQYAETIYKEDGFGEIDDHSCMIICEEVGKPDVITYCESGAGEDEEPAKIRTDEQTTCKNCGVPVIKNAEGLWVHDDGDDATTCEIFATPSFVVGCGKLFQDNKDGVLLYDGVMHAEWWCSFSCLIGQLVQNGFSNDEIAESIEQCYKSPNQWGYGDFSSGLVGGVTVCGSVV